MSKICDHNHAFEKIIPSPLGDNFYRIVSKCQLCDHRIYIDENKVNQNE